MAKSPPSNATPAMLVWAREKAHLTKHDVAKMENVSIHDIDAWESGNKVPSLAQLRSLAGRYKYPLMVFYLPEPPQDFNVVRDFRASAMAGRFTPQLAFAIRYAQQRQAFAADYLDDLDSERVSLVGSITRDSTPKDVAASLRASLSVSIADQTSWGRDQDAFYAWRSAVEAAGICVFQAIGVEVSEMRGFALPHELAPVAVVNSGDAPTAKCFTLIHEVVHILLGESALTAGVSGTETDIDDERFCNTVAAETLVPTDDFVPRVPPDWLSRDDEVLRKAAQRYHVSRAVIAIRLYETGFATRKYLDKKLPQLKTPAKDGGGISTQYDRALGRNGEYFSRLAVSAYHAGSIQGGGLTELIGLKLKHLPYLESRLFPSQIQPLLSAGAS